jgi:hypothetical protein
MKQLFSIGAVLILALTTAAAQETTSTERGDRNASIGASATTAVRQTGTRPAQQTPRPTPSPVAPVRPLSPEDTRRQQEASERRRQAAASGDPDVLLDVPNLSVDEITLKVKNLRARVSLDARLANLLQLTAGADVGIDEVDLTIKGVKAEVLLKVYLDNVAAIIDRTLTTIDRNPQILERLLQSVDNTVGTVGGVANTALQPGGVADNAVSAVGNTLNNLTQPNGLLSQTVNSLGQTVQRVVDRSGVVVERTLDAAGTILNQRSLGSLTDLGATVLNETTNTAGQTIRRVRDTSGAVIELTLDQAGRVVNSRVVNQATRQQ